MHLRNYDLYNQYYGFYTPVFQNNNQYKDNELITFYEAIELIKVFINDELEEIIRNKKVQLQIVTSEPRVAKMLIQQFPHGCTIVDAKGAFYNSDKKIIFTVISSFELKKATQIIYKIDPHAFVTVNNAFRVYGKFFLKPIQ